MYRLIIADDEKAACKRLELFTKQEFPEIEIADIVNDGYELVRRVEELKPDIAIVDVNMPGMNGIEAIKLLHEREVKTRFIINTAYDEFDYVKQALDLKVDAYLLKPERKENFLETIRKICESIRKEQEETDTKMQRELLLLDMQEVLESDIVYSILMGETPGKSMSMYCELHDLTFCGASVVTILPLGFEEESGRQARAAWKEIVHRALEGLCNGIVHVTEHGISLVVLVRKHSEEQPNIREWLQDLVYLAVEELNQSYPRLHFRVGIGGVYENPEELPRSYQESLEKLYNRTSSEQAEEPEGKLEKWQEQLKEIGYKCKRGQVSNYVQEAVRYIEQNYVKDIALDNVSEAIGISPSYVSRLFSQELGITFVEYLTELRIVEAAKFAASSKLSLKQIAEQIGYPNTAYLCRVFKRYTGKTIGQVRKEAQSGTVR